MYHGTLLTAVANISQHKAIVVKQIAMYGTRRIPAICNRSDWGLGAGGVWMYREVVSEETVEGLYTPRNSNERCQECGLCWGGLASVTRGTPYRRRRNIQVIFPEVRNGQRGEAIVETFSDEDRNHKEVNFGGDRGVGILRGLVRLLEQPGVLLLALRQIAARH